MFQMFPVLGGGNLVKRQFQGQTLLNPLHPMFPMFPALV